VKLKDYLNEDLGEGDVTSDALLGDEVAVGAIVAKDDCVVAGLEEATGLFRDHGLKADSNFKDGDNVKNGDEVLRVEGKAKAILGVERTALNFIMRMSGIATETSNLAGMCRRVNKDIRIAATRKTTPGFREFEKKAVEIGGGWTHRRDLSDFILIKDNHLKVVGSIEEAIKRASKSKKKVEIEVTDIDEAVVAVRLKPDMIMLDNMTPDEVEKASKKIRNIDKDVKIEVSGNITSENILEYAPFADIISMGALTHSARSRNFSLEIIAVHR
jgi:nicotinate-nucleotide pyrophosphorylase (carboxylating)